MSKSSQLTGSPYQVESTQRKWAIEIGESDANRIKQTPNQCPYYMASLAGKCGWARKQGKEMLCKPFKCKFYQERIKTNVFKEPKRLKVTCGYCAYYCQGKCHNKKVPTSEKPRTKTAVTFCQFYCRKGDSDFVITRTKVLKRLIHKTESKLQSKKHKLDYLIQNDAPNIKKVKASVCGLMGELSHLTNQLNALCSKNDQSASKLPSSK